VGADRGLLGAGAAGLLAGGAEDAPVEAGDVVELVSSAPLPEAGGSRPSGST
jgi:hypothetical protein